MRALTTHLHAWDACARTLACTHWHVHALTHAVRMGWLHKESKHVKRWDKWWFVLEGEQLCYFDTDNSGCPRGVLTLEVGGENESDKWMDG